MEIFLERFELIEFIGLHIIHLHKSNENILRQLEYICVELNGNGNFPLVESHLLRMFAFMTFTLTEM